MLCGHPHLPQCPGKRVWEQEYPEAQLYWVPGNHEGDVFDKYFSGFQCFKDWDFGWQLRFEVVP